MNKKIMVVCLALLSLFVLSGCSEKTLVEGEVERVGNDLIIVNNQIYDLCYEDEDKVSKGDYVSILSSRTGTGGGCNSELLKVIPNYKYHYHKHKEYSKENEVVVIVKKTIVKEHTHKTCRKYEYTYCDFRKNLKKKNCKTFTTDIKLEEFEGGDYWLNLEREITVKC